MARNTGSAEPRQTNTDQMAKAETEDIYEEQTGNNIRTGNT